MNFTFTSQAEALSSKDIRSRTLQNLDDFGVSMIEVDSHPSRETWWVEIAEEILSYVGRRIRVFKNDNSLWRQIGVDTNRPINSSGGVGRQPLHIDFVNASKPPDYVALACIRPDPLGGGKTLLSSIDGILGDLDGDTISVLSEKRVSTGQFFNLTNIGHDCNPFPIFDQNAEQRLRYTEKIFDVCQDTELFAALENLQTSIRKQTFEVEVRHAAMLILDQGKWLHGRTALGNGQDLIPINRRRLLLQSFARKGFSVYE